MAVFPDISRRLTHLVPILIALSRPAPGGAQSPGAAIDSLPQASTRLDERYHRLTIQLPLIEVPAYGMILTPVYRVTIPAALSLYGAAVEVVDETGKIMPRDRLHHFIMNDPARRELFLPLTLPIFGASKESANLALPRYLFGLPLPASGRYFARAMLTNPEGRARRFQVRLLLSYVHPSRLIPLFRVYPWMMDVKYPLGGAGGRHDFDVPSGHSTYSWEGSPGVPGTIIAMTGHAHDFVTSIEFRDATTGQTIWRQTPIRDAEGHLRAIPIGRFYRWYRLGIHIQPAHIYRITVVYDNPTGYNIPFGGMGSVVGLIVPDRGVAWPAVSPNDPIYRAQLKNLLGNTAGIGMGSDMQMAH